MPSLFIFDTVRIPFMFGVDEIFLFSKNALFYQK